MIRKYPILLASLLRMRKVIALLGILFLMPIGIVYGLVYDPVTNTYINENASSDTSVDTTVDDQDEVENNTQEQETSESVDDDSSTLDIATNTNSNFSDEEEIDPNTISSVSTFEEKIQYDGPLEYLHVLLDEHTSDLQDSLREYYGALKSQSNDLLDDDDTKNGRLAQLKCLGVLDDESGTIEQITLTYKQLQKKIDIETTDIHSDITALENKIDNNLLEQLEENLEIASLQNKVDAYHTEYTNVVDMFHELSSGEVEDIDGLIAKAEEKYGDLFDVYDKRVAAYEELEEAYDEFIKKSSFAGVLAGPNMQSLLTVLDEIEVYYRSLFIESWKEGVGTHIPSNHEIFLDNQLDRATALFSTQFAANVDGLLNGLYPVEKLQALHKNVLAVRAAYLVTDSESYDCKAFTKNQTIELASPQLISDMDDLLNEINVSVQKVADRDGDIPKDLETLKKGLIAVLEDNGTQQLVASIDDEKIRLQTTAINNGINWMPIGIKSQSLKQQGLVRAFLQAKYFDALQKGKTQQFKEILQDAHDKIVTTFEVRDPTGKTRQMLESIKEVIEEFL